jgi:hypothetical protein
MAAAYNEALALMPDDQPGAFLYVLEHIIGLDTPAKRDRVTVNAGITTAEDLLYVEMDSMIECSTNNTTIIAKTRLKTLKKWAEDEYDIEGNVDVRKFTKIFVRKDKEVSHALPSQGFSKRRKVQRKKS